MITKVPIKKGTATEVRLLLDLGLKPYEARVLAALLDLGEGNSATIAQASGVPRTSIYGVATALVKGGLVRPVATVGSMQWTCAGWEAVLDGLEALADKRLSDYLAIVQRARDTVA